MDVSAESLVRPRFAVMDRIACPYPEYGLVSERSPRFVYNERQSSNAVRHPNTGQSVLLESGKAVSGQSTKRCYFRFMTRATSTVCHERISQSRSTMVRRRSDRRTRAEPPDREHGVHFAYAQTPLVRVDLPSILLRNASSSFSATGC